ncbi:MAG TPA: hypothetical protein VFI53_21105 [Myxococcaceae bacterium]|nr:hypothetical protein [Myxococcaceae bacterium]
MDPRSIVLGLVLVVAPPAAHGWSAPSFLGFRLGSATLKAVRHRLGGVVVVMEGAGPGEKTLQIEKVRTPFGEATVELDFDARRRLSYVRIWPFQPLSREEIHKIAGPLQSRRYAAAACSNDAEWAPLVERADGPFEYLVSPEKGLSAPIRGDMVERIQLSIASPDAGTCP